MLPICQNTFVDEGDTVAIGVVEGCNLTISGPGLLNVTVNGNYTRPAIGGCDLNQRCGSVTITGGMITVTSDGVGIGVGDGGIGGVFEVAGGFVDVNAGLTGIGSGWGGQDVEVKITGGRVMA